MSAAKSSQRSLQHLLAGYGVPAPDIEVTGIEIDSRRVAPGDLFLATSGQGTHGLAHLEQALERGASAIAWEPAQGYARPDVAAPEVAVPQLGRRAGEIAARFHGHPAQKMFCVGVTGTDGKTSTAYLIAQAFDRLNRPCAYIGTLGFGFMQHMGKGSHTTPDPVSLQKHLAQIVGQGARALAMEVSSHALDQERVGGMKFDVAILTNITRDHLDYHGTVDNYAAAKRKLFERGELQCAVFNRDDAYGRRWAVEFAKINSAKALVYGLDGDVPKAGPYVIGRALRLHSAGLSFEIDSSWGQAKLDSRLLGRFNAYNLLAALAALLHAGIPLQQAVAALAQSTTVPGRIEGFRGAKARALVVVDYAHTPDALAQILNAVRAHVGPVPSAGGNSSVSRTPAKRGKLYCVFGCGGDRDRGKRPLMGAAAAKLADVLILTDDNPRSEKPQEIVAEILAGLPAGYAARVVHDRAIAIRTAVTEAGEDDVVVIAGKGHEDTQTYGSEVRAFSDRGFVAGLVGQS